MTTLATRPASRAATIATWVVQVVMGLLFVGGGMAKLFADPALVDLFDEIGAGTWLMYFVGACEVAGGIGLLIPRLCGFAAAALSVLIVGAIVTNVAIVDENPTLPIVYLVVLAGLVYRRRDRITAPFTLFR
jgi:putative oxidoreductase